MSKTLSVSIIITSYNQESSLRLLLATLDRQSTKDFEAVIADDGSSDGTAHLCREVRSFPIQFITQRDEGYRKSKILNEAIRNAQADYLLFLDGDVILERHFVEDHLSLRRVGHFVCGRRVDLGAEISQSLSLKDVSSGKFDHMNVKLILSALKKDTTSLKRSVRVTSPFLRKLLRYDRPLDILGSNLGIWKSDIKGVNGFNEIMESYWGEDGDLYIRLRNSGKIAIGAKSLCIQYHVFHKRRMPTQENIEKYQQLLKNTEYKWALHGLENKNLESD